MFLSIEGINGSGKTTISKGLVERFPKYELVRFPGYTKLGKTIRDTLYALPDVSPLAKFFLFLADMQETFDKMPNDVISDRSALSTLVYQTHYQQLSYGFVRSLATLTRLPDKIVLLTVDPSAALDRLFARDKETIPGFNTPTVEDLIQLQGKYLHYANHIADEVYSVDTTERDPDDVIEEIVNEVF